MQNYPHKHCTCGNCKQCRKQTLQHRINKIIDRMNLYPTTSIKYDVLNTELHNLIKELHIL